MAAIRRFAGRFGQFGKDSRRTGMRRIGLGDDRIARRNGRGEIAAGGAVKREGKVVRSEDPHRAQRREGRKRMLAFVSIVASRHEPSNGRRRLPQLARRSRQFQRPAAAILAMQSRGRAISTSSPCRASTPAAKASRNSASRSPGRVRSAAKARFAAARASSQSSQRDREFVRKRFPRGRILAAKRAGGTRPVAIGRRSGLVVRSWVSSGYLLGFRTWGRLLTCQADWQSASRHYLSDTQLPCTIGLTSVPMPSIQTLTTSPGRKVKSRSGTTPVPVSRNAPKGNELSRPSHWINSSNERAILPTLVVPENATLPPRRTINSI